MFKRSSDAPVCGFDKKPCRREGCMFWIQVRGKHPQTGAEIDLYDCSHRWVPHFLLEVVRKENETGAAVEGFRNEMVNANHGTAQMVAALLLRTVPAAETPALLEKSQGDTATRSRK